MVAKAGGIALCILLIMSQMGNKNRLVQDVCGFSPATSCDDVTESPAGTLFGWLHMSELGAFYFAGGFLTITLAQFSLWADAVICFLIVLNFLTLPYTVFSVYYQWKVVERWCPLCLGVIVLFWVEFLIFVLTYSIETPRITDTEIGIILWGFLTPMILWAGFKRELELSRETPGLKTALAKFKSDSEIFSFLLNQEEAAGTEVLKGDIVLGAPKAKMSITMIAGPFCGYCYSAYMELEKVINEFEEDARVIIRILDMTKRDVSRHLVAIGISGEKEARDAIREWYSHKHKDPGAWIKRFPLDNPPDHESVETQMDEIAKWCKENNIMGTPTFIVNGQRMPRVYQISDVKFYLRALFEKIDD